MSHKKSLKASKTGKVKDTDADLLKAVEDPKVKGKGGMQRHATVLGRGDHKQRDVLLDDQKSPAVANGQAMTNASTNENNAIKDESSNDKTEDNPAFPRGVPGRSTFGGSAHPGVSRPLTSYATQESSSSTGQSRSTPFGKLVAKFQKK